MGTVRSYSRFITIILWTTIMYPLMMVCNTVLNSNWDRRLRVQTALIRFWANGVVRIAGIRVTAKGTPPTAPFIQVSNHITYIDMVMMWSQLGCSFVSRADLEHWPVMGRMSVNLNTLFINREDRRDTKRVNEKLANAYNKGIGMHIFVEGGISQDAEIAPFKAPLLEPAIAKGVPVHYAALSYQSPDGYPPAKDVVTWKLGVPLFRNILNILALPHVNATVHFGAEPMTAPDRKQLATKLREGVIELFTPMT
jgi:1-acyl-sn-glycerol-3-phosphate acyltransferase